MSTTPNTGLPNTTNGGPKTSKVVTVPRITAFGTRVPSVVYFDKPFNLINFTSTTTNYATLFTLVTPLTSRQPLFTANGPILNGFVSRVFFFQRYRRPQIISIKGSTGPTSLLQLDNPVSKIDIPDTSPSARFIDIEDANKIPAMADQTANPTIYGATITSTVSTTVTANPGDVIYLRFPSPTRPDPVRFTTLPLPTDYNSKQFPNGQAILVVTEVDGVLVNSASSTFSTATIVQAPPSQVNSDPEGAKVALADPLYTFSTWSKGEKIGVVLAGIVALIAVTLLLARLRKVSKQRRKHQGDAEKDDTVQAQRTIP